MNEFEKNIIGGLDKMAKGTHPSCQVDRVVSGETLHLHLCYEYFDAIKNHEKPEEYRDAEKWQKKLDAKNYKWIRLYRAYQKVSKDTIIDLPYKGYILKTIVHPHFGGKPKLVCAIDVDH